LNKNHSLCFTFKFQGVPFCHFTFGIGDPTATQVMFSLPFCCTSYFGSGGMENRGATRRTKKQVQLHKVFNDELSLQKRKTKNIYLFIYQ